MEATKKPELLVVTGMSGAGRSTVGNALEDQGWYVIDNLPPQLLGPISDLFSLSKAALPRIAVIIDVRGGEFFNDLQVHLTQLRQREINVRLLFLEANDSALVKRFESVRRPHPLQADGTVLDGIAKERKELLGLRESADLVFDTSDSNVHQLTNRVAEAFDANSRSLKVNVMSFGFKYGLPADADLVADARFIPNPHWREELRAKTGNDSEVSEYVLSQPGVEEFLKHYAAGLKHVLAGYRKENKRFATIAIGCTGGKHRSVAIANQIAKILADEDDVKISVQHRDLGRE
ncbi:MAG: RNase adapter RapZ [Aquiluna sp.]|nr:RNase adapter RapZ [Aquiluna sp.]MCF8545045.1 RNase adapter RapZ [Aquiluna sp.]